MTKELPPYVNATGTLKKVLEQIKIATVPTRFTQDFLATKLNFGKSGSTMAIIPFFKKVGLLGSDGTPTGLYEEFRTKDIRKSGIAIAKAMKIGYADLYEKNEYFHDLNKSETRDFLVTATGSDSKNATLTPLNNTLEVLKGFATFDQKIGEDVIIEASEKKRDKTMSEMTRFKDSKSDFNIAYTINLNLPETSDPAVFDAIFKSLKEHILSGEE